MTERGRGRHIAGAWLAMAAILCAAQPATQAQQITANRAATPLSKTEKSAAAAVNMKTIQTVTADLSAPEMEGRGTATAGGERAARYLADRFAKLGLKPLGDNGTYLQAVKFRGTQFTPETALTSGDVKLKFGEEFVVPPQVARDNLQATGGLVIVGYGVVSEKLKRDDLAGIDLKGKIAIVLSGQPDGVDPKAWAEAANPFSLVGTLIGKGAAGILLVNPQFGKTPFPKIADYLSRRSVAPADRPAGGFPMPAMALVSEEGATRLLAAAGLSLSDLAAKAKSGQSVSTVVNRDVSLAVRLQVEEAVGSNVVAVLPGADPVLKDQAIVYSAHYDAFGVGVNGKIYPGAADNALGVAEIVAIAEAFSKQSPKPRRSIIFLAVTGEEHGMLGAYHWAKNPTWPIDKVAANINYDGIGTEVFAPVKSVVGFGAEHSEIGGIFDSVSAAMALSVVPDPMPEEKAFYRSDHIAFVKQGIPALMLLGAPEGEAEKWVAKARSWMESDYHQATDTIKPDWDWSGPQTIAQVGLVVGMRIAAADAMPEWNKTSEFFKARTPAANTAGAGTK